MRADVVNQWLEALALAKFDQEDYEGAMEFVRAADLFREFSDQEEYPDSFHQMQPTVNEFVAFLRHLAILLRQKNLALSMDLGACAPIAWRQSRMPTAKFFQLDCRQVLARPETGELLFRSGGPSETWTLGERIEPDHDQCWVILSNGDFLFECETLSKWVNAFSLMSSSSFIQFRTEIASEILHITEDADETIELAWRPSERFFIMKWVSDLLAGRQVEAVFDHVGGDFWAPQRVFWVGIRLVAIGRILAPERSGPLRGQWKEPGIAGLWIEA